MLGLRVEEKSERERYLELEVEHCRKAEWEREEEWMREREERVREREERRECEMRCADDWPEALAKQVVLFEREAALWSADDAEFVDTWFGPGAEVCRRALEIWREVEAERQPEVDALRARIAAIEDGIREVVARRLECEGGGAAWEDVVRALREDDPEGWLCW